AFLELLKNRKKDGAEEEKYRKVEIKQDTFSIRAQKKKILGRLKSEKKLSFFSLFEQQATQMEIAVTFIALLELWHTSTISIRQKSAFNDITLEYQNGGMAS
ncbi:MAG: segregation/condensation protein A, partial [Christensenella sp.]|uniref:segregation/condensation protein A n=1 Tax=Christensenella sp. TaxID=1935934 RepID=UPI002B1ED055